MEIALTVLKVSIFYNFMYQKTFILEGIKKFYYPVICVLSQFACVSSSAILIEILKSPDAFSESLWLFEIYRSSISE